MASDAAAGLSVLGGRRVLVTGHTGFKGSWLAQWLCDLGAEVTGLALAPATDPNLCDVLGLAGRLTDCRGDVRSPEIVVREVDRARPDVIFHLAAQAIVRAAYPEPAATFATNVMGTVHLLDAVRTLGRPCAVVVVTSDKCYEDRGLRRAYQEDDPLGGHDPYSASKGAAEIVAASYRRSFFPPERFAEHGVSVATVRAGNVIGGGDFSPDRVVPDILRSLLAGQPARLRNPGADGLAGAWNFGPESGDAIPVSELTEQMLRAWGDGSWIDATVAWYKAAERGANRDEVTREQIASFTVRAKALGQRWAGAAR